METNAFARRWRSRSLSTLSRAVGFILGVATIGIQACDGDGATEPSSVSTPVSTPTGSFTLLAAPASVLKGGDGESKITIVRSGGFTGSVALAVTGALAGLSATITPSSTTGTTATLVVTTAAVVAVGSASLTITGTAAGLTDQTTTATVAITPSTGGTGNVRVDFSTCSTTSRPNWFAFQDGTGAWTQILDSANVYRFNVASTKGGYAFVSRDFVGAVGALTVSLRTQAELTGSTISPCGTLAVPTKTVSGTLVVQSTSDVVYVGLGGGYVDPEGGPAPPRFTLTGIADGNQDFIAYRSDAFGSNDRAIIRRDQNIANNGTLGTIDFAAAESFAPATAAMTVTGAGSLPIGHSMSYYAGAGCSYYDLYGDPRIGPNFTMRGIPAAKQRATDFHQVTAWVSLGDSYRSVSESFHTLANMVIAFPADVTALTVTAPPGGHKRIQAALTLPSDYNTSLYLSYYAPQGGEGPR